jgi:hypothetical protein
MNFTRSLMLSLVDVLRALVQLGVSGGAKSGRGARVVELADHNLVVAR